MPVVLDELTVFSTSNWDGGRRARYAIFPPKKQAAALNATASKFNEDSWLKRISSESNQ
jgi:hypothetical protein